MLRRKQWKTVLNMFNYVKSKDTEKYLSLNASESAEATGPSRTLVCMKGMKSLQ